MFNFTVRPDDGEQYDVTGTSRDVVKWERLGQGRSLARLQTPQMRDLYELAHLAAQRTGKFGGSLDDFVDRADLEFHQEQPDEESGPTNPGR